MVSQKKPVDIALIGDSMVEHLQGTELGQLVPEDLARDLDVFDQLFTKQGGGKIDGLALGIGGDRCSNLLYRLQHGELTADFTPKVWWIMVGTSDWELGTAPGAIVAGIVHIVQVLRLFHTDAQIVINSLLPRSRLDDNESIQSINERLGCFVKAQSLMDDDQDHTVAQAQQQQQQQQQHHHKRRLHFFNATNIFEERQDDGQFVVNPAFLVPNAEEEYRHAHGEFLWGQKIVENVLQLIEHEKEDN